MVETDALRASDRDRQDVVDRLRTAVGDGRLQMDEYMERMETAYEAVTLGELAPLYADLPVTVAAADGRRRGAVMAPARAALTVWHRFPGWLRVLWVVWVTSVVVDVVVWALVGITTGHFLYPGPVRSVGPGAALFAISMTVSRGRRVRS